MPMDGWKAVAHGWGLKEYEHEEVGKVNVFLAVSGWETHEKAVAASERHRGLLQVWRNLGRVPTFAIPRW